MFKQWGVVHRGIRNVVAIQILLYVIPLFGNTCMIKILSEFMSRWNPPEYLWTDTPPLGTIALYLIKDFLTGIVFSI